jgi:hypothetical protein
VDTSIKHDRVRRVFEVAAAHWGDGGDRGTSAGWGESDFTVFSLGVDVLGLLAGLGHDFSVSFIKGVLHALPTVGSGISLSFGREFGAGSCVIGVFHSGALGVTSATVGVVAVGIVTWGASACELPFARAWAEIAAVTGGGVGMGLGREEGLGGRGRRVPASDPCMPIEVLG